MKNKLSKLLIPTAVAITSALFLSAAVTFAVKDINRNQNAMSISTEDAAVLAENGVQISGATVSRTTIDGADYLVVKWERSGEMVVTDALNDVEYLVVGGGGAGSMNYTHGGVGGHGGEVTQNVGEPTIIQPGSIEVTVGKGGRTRRLSLPALPGAPSSFGDVIAAGGEGGVKCCSENRNGNNGTLSNISGANQFYGGGGGDYWFKSETVGGQGGLGGGGNGNRDHRNAAGINGLGGGGGGAAGSTSYGVRTITESHYNYSGGSGVVIIRFPV